MFALAITFAIVPALLLLWYFHSRDAYPEPPRVVWATFFLGVLTIPAVLLVALPASHLLTGFVSPYQFGFADAFVCAAIPEECCKFLVVFGYAARHREFNEPMDGVVYGVAASLGFATLENVMYVGSGGLGVGVLRALTAVPGHAFTGVVMGYYVGRARFARPEQRGGFYALALLLPILLHGMYDFPLLVVSRWKKVMPQAELPGLMTLLVLVSLLTLMWELRLARLLVRRLRAEQDAERGAAAVLPVVLPVAGLATAPAAVVVAAAPGTQRTFSVLGWAQVLVGGAMLTGAGLFAALLVIGVASGANHDPLGAAVGGAVLLVGPTLVGVWLFRRGIRRLNRAESAVLSPGFG